MHDDIDEDSIKIDYNVAHQLELSVVAQDDQVPMVENDPRIIPEFYKNIVHDVANEMNSRYNFAHQNPKLQLVKRADAGAVFKLVHAIIE